MNKIIKKAIQFFYLKKDDCLKKRLIKKAVKDSLDKNERILEQLNDNMDYDGMGNHGRFPPIKKIK
jgi:hypothetical protein